MSRAKVLLSGDSQVILLPEGFRFPRGTESVQIRRDGDALVLKPQPLAEWPEAFWAAFDGMPEDFERPHRLR